ncbi:MYB-like DNA-binding domain-containing protein [Cryptosporidium andersoni]|uniref:MYB-like DNA-binding domain-containing protein n=1 Tax=Cryptosporidium andersoni TaxID=117008 RepID=A0A1J4MR67_9CRYT|nr:MYB-like DNA-binding domain-containing protein [Cryptosporidium andersoni]
MMNYIIGDESSEHDISGYNEEDILSGEYVKRRYDGIEDECYDKITRKKRYVLGQNVGKWTDEEHHRFVAALKKFGRNWTLVQQEVKSRTLVQIRSHAQKYFLKKVRGITPSTVLMDSKLVSTASDGIVPTWLLQDDSNYANKSSINNVHNSNNNKLLVYDETSRIDGHEEIRKQEYKPIDIYKNNFTESPLLIDNHTERKPKYTCITNCNIQKQVVNNKIPLSDIYLASSTNFTNSTTSTTVSSPASIGPEKNYNNIPSLPFDMVMPSISDFKNSNVVINPTVSLSQCDAPWPLTSDPQFMKYHDIDNNVILASSPSSSTSTYLDFDPNVDITKSSQYNPGTPKVSSYICTTLSDFVFCGDNMGPDSIDNYINLKDNFILDNDDVITLL